MDAGTAENRGKQLIILWLLIERLKARFSLMDFMTWNTQANSINIMTRNLKRQTIF